MGRISLFFVMKFSMTISVRPGSIRFCQQYKRKRIGGIEASLIFGSFLHAFDFTVEEERVEKA